MNDHEHEWVLVDFDGGHTEQCKHCQRHNFASYFRDEDFKSGEEWVNPMHAHVLANEKADDLLDLLAECRKTFLFIRNELKDLDRGYGAYSETFKIVRKIEEKLKKGSP